MTDLSTLFAFAAAVAVLALIPGPNVALITANSLAWGPRYGLLTVAGTGAAMAVQLGAVALGAAEMLRVLGEWFGLLRFAGAAYLIGLGILHWRAPVADLSRTQPEPRSAGAILLRALLVSLSNPKTLLFYGAFLPQFIRTDRAAGPQLALLSAVFILVAVAVDSGWALLAGRARGVLLRRGRLRNRVTGGVLIGAGAAWALNRNP